MKGDFAAVSQDVEMEVGCEGHSVGLAEDEDDSLSGVAGKSDSGGVEDVMNTEKEPETGDDECEVTSPDFIPSSQTPSCDSPFQSLRRVTIPLSSILPNSLDSMKSVLNAGKNKLEKPQPETERGEEGGMETGGESDEENSTEKCKSSVKVGETASTVSKTTVSPVAGRTRRRLQQKTAAENSSSQTEPEIEPNTHMIVTSQFYTKQTFIQDTHDCDDTIINKTILYKTHDCDDTIVNQTDIYTGHT